MYFYIHCSLNEPISIHCIELFGQASSKRHCDDAVSPIIGETTPTLHRWNIDREADKNYPDDLQAGTEAVAEHGSGEAQWCL